MKAEECRQRAEESATADDKAEWLRLAERWEALAGNAEATHAKPGGKSQ
jgi:hypothetical protein